VASWACCSVWYRRFIVRWKSGRQLVITHGLQCSCTTHAVFSELNDQLASLERHAQLALSVASMQTRCKIACRLIGTVVAAKIHKNAFIFGRVSARTLLCELKKLLQTLQSVRMGRAPGGQPLPICHPFVIFGVLTLAAFSVSTCKPNADRSITFAE